MIDALPSIIPQEMKDLHLPIADNAKKSTDLWEASKAFETIFSKQLMGQFSKSIPGITDAVSGSIYADMFAQSVADKIADSGAIGLAKQIYMDAYKRIEHQGDQGKKQGCEGVSQNNNLKVSHENNIGLPGDF
jgi:Rod binding domain-containing protein